VTRGRKDSRKESGKEQGRVQAMGGDTLRLITDYVKQETLGPLKGLGRFVVFGVAGSLCLAVGLVILAVGLLRLLQGETGRTFDGNWSWAPYLICMVAALGVSGVALIAIGRGQAKRAPDGNKETA
jgi:Putative Actinobacterial Holin-X, holin superfamily III